ncbi:alpha/beta hydrolase family domain-containing protein [Rhizoctonia solani AG-1 IA]|uniref:Alpha/beta hydrolase family domain-containing protein n=1 Tax=Thanatephorus cucumeris (strain AG1-IA) TaxID=983506 RepID=L8WNI1_THACA|nr:alpha/beta hydrolase family domain-containing protein [Rhizoctonia solani AG-1 IA]
MSPTTPVPPSPRSPNPASSSQAQSQNQGQNQNPKTITLASALLQASHAESLKGGTADLLSILERDSKPWGFSYADVRQPVRVWYGDRDDKIGIGSVRWMERVMKSCEVKIVKGAGHSLMTNAEVVVEVLESIAKEWDHYGRYSGRELLIRWHSMAEREDWEGGLRSRSSQNPKARIIRIFEGSRGRASNHLSLCCLVQSKPPKLASVPPTPFAPTHSHSHYLSYKLRILLVRVWGRAPVICLILHQEACVTDSLAGSLDDKKGGHALSKGKTYASPSFDTLYPYSPISFPIYIHFPSFQASTMCDIYIRPNGTAVVVLFGFGAGRSSANQWLLTGSVLTWLDSVADNPTANPLLDRNMRTHDIRIGRVDAGILPYHIVRSKPPSHEHMTQHLQVKRNLSNRIFLGPFSLDRHEMLGVRAARRQDERSRYLTPCQVRSIRLDGLVVPDSPDQIGCCGDVHRNRLANRRA